MSKLEALWPEQHFRGPHAGPMSYWKRVVPHFLGFHANFTRCQRKVYIDVGAGTFSTSSSEGLLSTLTRYPPLLDFDEFYAFEAVSGKYQMPAGDELIRVLRRAGISPERAATFSRRHFFNTAFVGSRSDPSTSPPTIGFSDFLRTMLQLQPADAVVVKMDVEGYEYEIVETLLTDGTTDLIDEMMVEVHYLHPDMRARFKWCKLPRPGWSFWCKYSLQNATTLYQSLRDAGVYAHHWP